MINKRPTFLYSGGGLESGGGGPIESAPITPPLEATPAPAADGGTEFVQQNMNLIDTNPAAAEQVIDKLADTDIPVEEVKRPGGALGNEPPNEAVTLDSLKDAGSNSQAALRQNAEDALNNDPYVKNAIGLENPSAAATDETRDLTPGEAGPGGYPEADAAIATPAESEQPATDTEAPAAEAEQPEEPAPEVEDKRTTAEKLKDTRENLTRLEASRKEAMKELQKNPSGENLQKVEDIEEEINANRIAEKGLEVDELAEQQQGKDPREKTTRPDVWKKVLKLEARQRALIEQSQDLPLRVAKLLPLKREAREKLKEARKEEKRIKTEGIVGADSEKIMKNTQDARHDLLLVCTDIVNNRFAAERNTLEYRQLDVQISALTGEVGILGRMGHSVLNSVDGYILSKVVSKSIEEEMKRDGSVLYALKNPVGQAERASMYAAAA